jgi:AcrR family transcriptional regulator
MNQPASSAIEIKDGRSDRQDRILTAAEACFVRNGFHRTTMQDLAREAAMTAGNFYRYFASKEALVLGLADRERQRGARLVEEMDRSGNRRAALHGILSEYFSSITREAAVLRLDLWSEATRNPAIAAIAERSEHESRLWFVGTLSALATSPDCNPAALYALLHPLMKGIIVSRALLPDYDPAPIVSQLRALIDAGLAGRLPQTSESNP